MPTRWSGTTRSTTTLVRGRAPPCRWRSSISATIAEVHYEGRGWYGPAPRALSCYAPSRVGWRSSKSGHDHVTYPKPHVVSVKSTCGSASADWTGERTLVFSSCWEADARAGRVTSRSPRDSRAARVSLPRAPGNIDGKRDPIGAQAGQTSLVAAHPASRARATAWAPRSVAPSLRRIVDTLFCTVLMLIPIRAAIASLRIPRASRSRISCSRSVRTGNGRSDVGAAVAAITRDAMPRSKIAWPFVHGDNGPDDGVRLCVLEQVAAGASVAGQPR